MPTLDPSLLTEEPAGFPVIPPAVQAQRDAAARRLKVQELDNPRLLPEERQALQADIANTKSGPSLDPSLLQDESAQDATPAPSIGPDGTLNLEFNTRSQPTTLESMGDAVKPAVDYLKQNAMGMAHGVTTIGANLMAPVDYVSDWLSGKNQQTLSGLVTGEKPVSSNAERKAAIDQFFNANADQGSVPFQVGNATGLMAGTAGVGPVLGATLKGVAPASSAIDALAASLRSGGMSLDALPATTTAGQIAQGVTRVAGGAGTGAGTAALADPSTASTGAIIGGAIPVVGAAAYNAGSALAKGLQVSPEIAALAQKAKQYGIDLPLDRITQSKPLDAFAASLKYVPGSGRIGTEAQMQSQFNRALSRTFGQDSDNVTQALRNAQSDLGSKFDSFLKGNTVKVDPQFQADITNTLDKAQRELSPQDFAIVKAQADNLLSKAQNGQIEGQSAYNVKKDLDRIGKRNSNEAWYAGELKDNLMDALNRSVGPSQAQEFGAVRQQYGAMRTLERLAKNGAEGDISAARLANMHDIRNPQIQDLADIAAQFLKARENDHGAAQRVWGTMLAGALGGKALMAEPITGALAAGSAVGLSRGANTLLNSNAARSMVIPGGNPQQALIDSLLNRGARTSVELVPALRSSSSAHQ